ncbi:hypothetical protein BDFB_010725 [Asbolus verrucosus]|uniref:Uncharacterized protein n=1 Tax=Asbolus verrucosus TaxID=1661398 RepID=A0A482UZL0_ASBVE|nr:hypothetical protein BDFB_010725 [Asbolus verrucosus]
MLQHNSLPRKGNFQRNAPARRSAGLSAVAVRVAANSCFAGAEPLIEYFVPRSVSEFDLSVATGDTPITGNFLPLTVRVPRKTGNKQKEKMVTFEDEMAAKMSKDPELQDGLKKCDDNCSCNAEAECDICKVIDFTLKKDKL